MDGKTDSNQEAVDSAKEGVKSEAQNNASAVVPTEKGGLTRWQFFHMYHKWPACHAQQNIHTSLRAACQGKRFHVQIWAMGVELGCPRTGDVQ